MQEQFTQTPLTSLILVLAVTKCGYPCGLASVNSFIIFLKINKSENNKRKLIAAYCNPCGIRLSGKIRQFSKCC